MDQEFGYFAGIYKFHILLFILLCCICLMCTMLFAIFSVEHLSQLR